MKHLLNLEDASKYVGRTKETLRKAIKNNEIPCRLFRGGYLFSTLVLDLWASGLNLEQIQEKILNTVTDEFVLEHMKIKGVI